MVGHDAQPVLEKAISYMISHMDEMREMNPPNGWGDAEGALLFLRNILDNVQLHPLAIVYVC